jgi:DinB superfamily/Pentapeptide repeats (8 copies)
MIDERPYPQGSRVDNLDLSGVHLHGADLEGVKLTDASLRGADISGDIEGLRINGVEIEPLVQAELDRRFPERVQLRSTEIEGLLAAWSMLEDLWAATTDGASHLDNVLHLRRVDGEWSFVETLRHLIFATDCWLFRGIQLIEHPYHPWGLPWTGIEPEWAQALGIDTAAAPSLAEVLPVRREHQRAVRSQLQRLTDSELCEIRSAPGEPGYPSGEHSVLQCLHVLLNEEWEHHGYAKRDCAVLGWPGAK